MSARMLVSHKDPVTAGPERVSASGEARSLPALGRSGEPQVPLLQGSTRAAKRRGSRAQKEPQERFRASGEARSLPARKAGQGNRRFPCFRGLPAPRSDAGAMRRRNLLSRFRAFDEVESLPARKVGAAGIEPATPTMST